MSIHHVYCVPKWAESTQDTLATVNMLQRVESSMKIPYNKRIFQRDEAHHAKLLTLSVKYRLRLPQTSKSKLTYSHLILCNENDDPIIFYPQRRRGKHGGEISINDYLKDLLGGRVKSLIEIPDLKKERLEAISLLREGYIAMAKDAKATNKEWEETDAPWPD